MKPVYGRVEEPKQSCFRINRKDDYRPEFVWHFHHIYELNLIVKGSGVRFVGDSIAHYEDGDLVLMGPELPHTWHGADSHYSIGIQFAETFLGAEVLKDSEWQHITSLFERAARGLEFGGDTRRNVARKIVGLERLKGPTRLVSFIGALEDLAHSAECRPLSSQGFVPALPSEGEKRIDKVCRYIAQNYTGELRQPEAAAVANMCVSGFAHFFKLTLGKTFTDYVAELRIGRACKLLIETDAGIAEIAFRSGFNNLSNFNRQFARLKKVTPKAYRHQYASVSALVAADERPAA